MQDVLWCFSQVKGAIDAGVTECKFIFPFVAVTKNNLSHRSCLEVCREVVCVLLGAAGTELSHAPWVLPSLCTCASERDGPLKLAIDPIIHLKAL